MLFEDEARNAIFLGVKQLAKAVKATLGPTGRNVVIKKNGSIPHITKDGVTVAREVVLEDHFQNLGVELVREVASRTAIMAGDGTTTATVIAESILENGARFLASGVNATELKRGIDLAVKVVVARLTELSKKITTTQEIIQVATVSANNDTEIGSLLGNLISEIGSDGVATIERSPNADTYIERVDGLQLRSGFFGQFFANKNNSEAVWDDPRILIYDGRLTAARDIIVGNGTGFLERALADNRPLVIFCDGLDGEAFHAIGMNRIQQNVKILVVKFPFTIDKAALLDDLAVMTGGQVFSREAGYKQLHKIDLDALGRASRVIATKDTTLILGGGGDSEKIKAKADGLLEQANQAVSEFEKRIYRERAAKLKKGIAIVRVGATSEVELAEKQDRIEDAIFAAQAAVEDGVVPGGGVALVRCIEAVEVLESSLANEDQRMGAQIIKKALASPLMQIAANADISGDVVLENVRKSTNLNYGFNARTHEYIDMLQAGIIDPAKVAKAALQNAAGVAGLILTTEVLLVEKTESQNSSKQS